MTTQPQLKLRNFEWSDIEPFFRLLGVVGPHGHREWPQSVEALRADLEYPRVQPEKNLALAELAGGIDAEIAGYAIVEPEQNIGRSVIGIANIAEENRADVTEKLIDWATQRAAEIAPIAHLATQDHEIELVGYVERNGWKRARKYLKLESEPGPARAAAVAANPAMYGAFETVADDQPVNELILNFIDSLTRVDKGS